ncbi:unnamed protein product [Pieris macdunnoughi]|uniref:Uncharacterized protein n=1 Tax=Pieris macdunnoughi TaxID=345717 RepID=A0A821TR40_9NEOP|nr:unnamed protein product [Pieris macdunnoughi]
MCNLKKLWLTFFIDHWGSEDMLPFIGNKNIYVSFNKCYSYKVINNKVIKTIEESLSCEEHEEADSRIIFHICQIDFDAEVVIRCSDSDILIILLGNMDHLKKSLKIWINMGVGNHQRYININELYRILGDSLCKALPCFHAITGCDYTPAFFRKGKVKPFKILENSEEYQLAFDNIISDDKEVLETTFVILEKFICQILPPCKVELEQHLLRVRYVTKIWRNAHLKHPTSLSPMAFGWTINGDKYDFVWFLGDQLPSSVADIIVQNDRVLEDNESSQEDDMNDTDKDSDDDDDDYEDASFCDVTIG